MEKELELLIESIEDTPLEYSIDPACQEILKSDLKANEKVTEMVNIYLKDYPGFTPLAEEFMHPSCLALHREIMPWFFTQCDNNIVEAWSLLLAAAKEWFPERNKTKLGATFCCHFSCMACTFGFGTGRMKDIDKDFCEWRYGPQPDSSTKAESKPFDYVFQQEATTAFAKAWNTLDCSEFLSLLADNCHYASQWVPQEMISKKEIEEYLTGRMETVKNNGNIVQAELGEILTPDPGDPCVLMYQGKTEDVSAIVTFETRDGKVLRYDMCMPGLFSFKRSGIFPV